MAANDYERIPYGIFFREAAAYKETYGGDSDAVFLEAHRLVPSGRSSKTVIVFSHPVGGGAYLPMVTALAKAGCHVIYCNTRYRGNDSALIMEKCVVDLGHCVRHAREVLGYEKVVLAGWSGGGPLSLFYQAQAERPTVRSTPAGDPPDLTAEQLVPVQGVLLLAAHLSRARILSEWLDPSIQDEARPFERERDLDLYDPRNPHQPPYAPEYLARFRQRQIERSQRISDWVHQTLAELREAGSLHDERAFVVHGTMADPRWLDPSIEPSERRPGWCYLGEPRSVNDGPAGLARFCTLRSWLSQWSLEDSNADGERCAADISMPVLVIGNRADDACPPSHTRRLFDAVGHADKELHEIAGATHYYFGQPDKLRAAVTICAAWLEQRGLF
jgi:pimeloyl-ACP methyl ester carboxylesterase